MYLFFDTETTGLPKDWNAPVTRLNNWPRMIQLAWQLYDEQGTRISRHNYLIQPEGFQIPTDAVRIHGITTEYAREHGVPVMSVLEEFAEAIAKSNCLVAHNMNFDENVVGAEFLRAGMGNLMDTADKLCLMRQTTDFCRLPGPYGFKWPSLQELYYTLFKTEFENAHDADVDVDISARCFFELKTRGIF
jgi:DNA polymerase-3 subunit epsilon